MALLGERVEAQQALDWGLVNFVYPDDRLLDEADALVERLAEGPTRSYAGSKQALNRMLYPDLDGQLDLEAEIQHALARTRDFQEGVAAFVEKRDAGVPGRMRPVARGAARPPVPPRPAPPRPAPPPSGARAVGAIAAGAAAIGALALGRLAVKRAVIGHLRIEELEVGRLRVGRARGGGRPGARHASEAPLGPPD